MRIQRSAWVVWAVGSDHWRYLPPQSSSFTRMAHVVAWLGVVAPIHGSTGTSVAGCCRFFLKIRKYFTQIRFQFGLVGALLASRCHLSVCAGVGSQCLGMRLPQVCSNGTQARDRFCAMKCVSFHSMSSIQMDPCVCRSISTNCQCCNIYRTAVSGSNILLFIIIA